MSEAKFQPDVVSVAACISAAEACLMEGVEQLATSSRTSLTSSQSLPPYCVSISKAKLGVKGAQGAKLNRT